MADISSFKPNGAGGASYNFKDATARSNISTLSNSVNSLGNRVTALENAGSGTVRVWKAIDTIMPLEDEYPNYYRGYGEDYGYITKAVRWIQNEDTGVWEQKTFDGIGMYNPDTDSYSHTFPTQLNTGVTIEEPKVADYILGTENIVSYAQVRDGTTPGTGSVVGYAQYTRVVTRLYIISSFVTYTEASEREGYTDTITLARMIMLE